MVKEQQQEWRYGYQPGWFRVDMRDTLIDPCDMLIHIAREYLTYEHICVSILHATIIVLRTFIVSRGWPTPTINTPLTPPAMKSFHILEYLDQGFTDSFQVRLHFLWMEWLRPTMRILVASESTTHGIINARARGEGSNAFVQSMIGTRLSYIRSLLRS